MDGSYGRLIVADTGNNRVVMTSFGGGAYAKEYGSVDGINFSSPEGGSVGYWRRAHVVDTENDRIHVFRHVTDTHLFSFGQSSAPPPPPPLALTGSRFAFEVGSYGSGPGEFRWPDNVAFGPGGVFAVSDWGNNRVNLFHPNGTFAYAIGSSGQGPGEFNRPFGIAFGPNGLLAVADVGNHRVQFFYLE